MNMNANQIKNGKAFEYACIETFFDILRAKSINAQVIENSSYQIAKNFFKEMKEEKKIELLLAAKAAYSSLIRFEPFVEQKNSFPIQLSLQADSEGQRGDVRDILFIRKNEDWEIGLSVKHNHEAVKHPRLSSTLNFGEIWFGVSCSAQYFSEIEDIFNELKIMKTKGMKWSEVDDKSTKIYVPILMAFKNELLRLSSTHYDVPKLLLDYLLGKNDFYKIISIPDRKETKIIAYPLHNSLNKATSTQKPKSKLPSIKLPSKFYDIDFKSDSTNTLIIVCDGGWQISLRLHSASTLVEPSLKFDIQLVGQPDMYTHYQPWDDFVNDLT